MDKKRKGRDQAEKRLMSAARARMVCPEVGDWGRVMPPCWITRLKTEVIVLIVEPDKDTRRVMYTAAHLSALFRRMKIQKAVRMRYRNAYMQKKESSAFDLNDTVTD